MQNLQLYVVATHRSHSSTLQFCIFKMAASPVPWQKNMASTVSDAGAHAKEKC